MCVQVFGFLQYSLIMMILCGKIFHHVEKLLSLYRSLGCVSLSQQFNFLLFKWCQGYVTKCLQCK